MRLPRWLPAAAFFLAGAPNAHAFVTPIDSLHYDYSNGIPLFQTPLRYVTIQGTVTCPEGVYSPTSTDVHLQDATGAIDVFVSGVLYGLSLGDSVEVSGYVKHFNGLTEIDSTAGLVTVTHLGPATILPEPLVMTCAQMNATFEAGPPAREPNESRLIRINGVHLTGGSWPTVPSGVNITLTITDATGSAILFIDRDTAVDGTPDPGSKFDLIGILRQFDQSSPFTSGYEIVPRFASDVIPQCPGPAFQVLPVAGVVSDQGATITWSTDTPSSGVLYYGTTTAYSDSAVDLNIGTTHSVTLSGLQARTLYHMQARVTDAGGSCFSSDRVFITWPAPGTPGEINLYFNYSVNTSVQAAGAPAAQGNVDVQSKLVQLINTATTSIDCALYSFSLSSVTNALIAAKNRGVLVRLIQDAGNSTTQANILNANGIPYVTSTYGGNHGGTSGGGIMHSKYVIVDAKAANKDLARVWTGSWNCSISGQNDCNNTIVLQDWGLAQAYTMDFDQMWGSSSSVPSSTNARMGARKSEVIPHLFNVGGIPVEAYMSPSDQTESHLIQNLWQSQHSLQFCILTFTSDPLSHAMKLHRDSTANYVVRGLFEPSEVTTFSEFCRLDGQVSCTDYWSPRADVLQDGSVAFDLLHHKYSILDEGYPGATVMTGSHNYSNAANTVNDENTLVVHDFAIANQYFQEFWARYLESGGAAASVDAGAGVAGLQLSQSRPNPGSGMTVIPFTLAAEAPHARLGVYDLSGRLVRTLIDGPVPAGAHEARWDGHDDQGRAVETGVYFYRLAVGRATAVRKLAFVR